MEILQMHQRWDPFKWGSGGVVGTVARVPIFYLFPLTCLKLIVTWNQASFLVNYSSWVALTYCLRSEFSLSIIIGDYIAQGLETPEYLHLPELQHVAYASQTKLRLTISEKKRRDM